MDIADWAARLVEMGVKFEICSVAVENPGFYEVDFHGFVRVVPTGLNALTYRQAQGSAVLSGASTMPVDLINQHNRAYLGTKTME